MNMPIPTSLKIGKTRYKIVHTQFVPFKGAVGYIDYANTDIHVAHYHNISRKKRTPKERAETFWHEVTHGILFDMGHRLFTDEKFVLEFSKRLNDAIHSAKFD